MTESSPVSESSQPEPGRELEPPRIELRRRSVGEQFDDYLTQWWHDNQFYLLVVAFLAGLVFVALYPRIFITIGPGEEGVVFRRFGAGTETHRTYPEGFYTIPPWDTMYVYDLRIQQRVVEFPILTKEGLEIGIHVSVRYHPRVAKLGLLHKRVGPRYFEKVVKPEIQSELRGLVGEYSAEEVYSTRRRLLEEALAVGVREINENFVVLNDLLITRVDLPERLLEAIESKTRAKQLALEFEHRLEKEEREARRKKIEATGIRDFQLTISQGISEDLLRWRGIEATLALAQSNNAKVVVIGGGKDGMPIILDTVANAERPVRAHSDALAPAPESHFAGFQPAPDVAQAGEVAFAESNARVTGESASAAAATRGQATPSSGASGVAATMGGAGGSSPGSGVGSRSAGQ